MKRAFGAILSLGCAAFFAGCSSQSGQDPSAIQKLSSTPISTGNSSPESIRTTPAPALGSSDEQVVARINGEPITMAELMKPLLEAHGLQILNALMQLDLLKQEAHANHETVTSEDILHERRLTLSRLFKDADTKEEDQLDDALQKGDKAAADKLQAQIDSDREALLNQYLENQHFSIAEFNLRMEINAYERKEAERLLTGKLTDAMVEKEFNVEYGETADIRYMKLANMQDVAEARQLLKTESFADVASRPRLNHDPRSVANGGLMPGISRETPGLPKEFKDFVFALKPGEVSPDTLNIDGGFYLVKYEKEHPPKAVKFASVKESLRKSMFDRLVQSLMGQINTGTANDVVKRMQIENPILKKQFDEMAARQKAEALNRQKMEEQWKKERGMTALTTQPATTAPASGESAAPAPAAAAPATQP